MNKSISNFFYCFILIFLTADLYAQKTVYIPASFNNSWEADYSNKNGLNGKISSLADLIDTDERWCKDRTYETDNFICFWEEGFGIDPAKMKNPAGSPSTFNLKTIMSQAEKVLVYQQETLNATYIDGINHNKYKIINIVSYTTTSPAYGSGYDYQCGSILMNPVA